MIFELELMWRAWQAGWLVSVLNHVEAEIDMLTGEQQ